MEMSPQRVRDVEFKSARKGVDPDEVREFLNNVADELERAQNQSAAMEARARAAVARLQEVSEQTTAATSEPPVSDAIDTSVAEAETISRTLLLAQRTADTTVAEARGESERIVRAANDEAAKTLDSTREMAAQLVVEARSEARAAGETERLTVAGEVDSLKARRDFLESDVEQLELFMTDQRSRIREAATSLLDITDRVPGGIGDARRPLLSASDDGDGEDYPVAEPEVASPQAEHPSDATASEGDDADGDLLIVTDLDDDATKAMPMVDNESVDSADPAPGNDDDFRFSFDDGRH